MERGREEIKPLLDIHYMPKIVKDTLLRYLSVTLKPVFVY